MRVKVQLFARLRELAGRSECDCDVRAGATVEDVWRTLAAEYPGLAPFGRAVSCAINTDFARKTAEVRDGDHVAFLPPVSGGSDPNL
jgi:molybdopterin converting factor subunit 1